VTIQMFHPPMPPTGGATSGSTKKPVRLHAHFVAYGSKAAAEVPMGLLVSVNATGNADNIFRIPGQLRDYKKLNGMIDDTKWVMYFAIPDEPKLSPTQLFVVSVIDGLSSTAQTPIKSAFLVIRKGTKKNADGTYSRVRVGPVLTSVIEPGESVSNSQPGAYGYLPYGDINVDAGNTKIQESNNEQSNRGVEWYWTDECGFWAVFFDSSSALGWSKANVVVTYSPSCSMEEVTDVKVV
jgi:hypothetical protein